MRASSSSSSDFDPTRKLPQLLEFSSPFPPTADLDCAILLKFAPRRQGSEEQSHKFQCCNKYRPDDGLGHPGTPGVGKPSSSEARCPVPRSEDSAPWGLRRGGPGSVELHDASARGRTRTPPQRAAPDRRLAGCQRFGMAGCAGSIRPGIVASCLEEETARAFGVTKVWLCPSCPPRVRGRDSRAGWLDADFVAPSPSNPNPSPERGLGRDQEK